MAEWDQAGMPVEGRDFLVFEETGERRLPVAASVEALPLRTRVQLPVRCWVRNTGMYEMREPGTWNLVRPLEGRQPPSRWPVPAPPTGSS